jgi:uncharacterized protein
MRRTTSTTLIASRTHTAILASAFLFVGLAGGYAQHTGRVQRAMPSEPQAIQLYLWALFAEWASVFYVWKGTRRGHVSLAELTGQRWRQPMDVVRDALMAAALWGAWIGIESVLPNTGTVHGLLPRTPLEMAVWVPVALSAGFCEELVFRGYFQKQFHALTGSLAGAIVLQAFVFGAGHFYEGTWAVAKITLYGGLFGLLAAWRKSLRPGMLAHAWTDIFAVL